MQGRPFEPAEGGGNLESAGLLNFIWNIAILPLTQYLFLYYRDSAQIVSSAQIGTWSSYSGIGLQWEMLPWTPEDPSSLE